MLVHVLAEGDMAVCDLKVAFEREVQIRNQVGKLSKLGQKKDTGYLCVALQGLNSP